MRIPILLSVIFSGTVALAQPVISSISSSSGYPGTTVVISGSNFDAVAGNNLVQFGATRGVVNSASSSVLNVTVPSGALCAPLSVLNTTTGLTAAQQFYFTPAFDASGYIPGLPVMNPKVDISAGSSLISTVISDIDGDGKPDIVTSNYGANTVYVYRNISTTGTLTSGSFDAPVSFATNTNPGYMRVADINNDGKPDIITPNANGTISVLRNTATAGSITSASFATKVDYTLSSNCNDVVVGDFNNDGKPDLAVTNFTANTISVLRNNSSGATLSFSVAATLSTAAQPGRLAVADFDGDGKIDIAISNNNSTGGISVFRNKDTSGTIATATFATKVDFATGTYLTGITCADYDGDGKIDIATTSNNDNALSIFRNTSTAGVINTSSFATRVDFGVGGNPQDVVNGDINGDGKPDLVVANSTSNNVIVWLNKAVSGSITTLSFGNNTFFTTGNGSRGIAVGDLDGDYIPDLVTANTTANTISILKNTPQANPPVITALTPVVAVPGTAISITGNNFSATPANNIIYFGATKATVISAGATTLTATVPVGATLGQVTLLNTTTGKIAVNPPLFRPTYDAAGLLPGAVNITPRFDLPAANGALGTAIGDIDGDGKSDIVGINYATNVLYLYRNVSVTGVLTSSSFSAAVTLSLPTNPNFCRLADVDADGKLDILVANLSGSISIFRNQATTGSISTSSFATRQDITVGAPYDVAVADFNRDGKPDIVVSNYSSNTLSVLKNTSVGTSLTFASAINLATNSQPARLFAGDIDGDGKADIVVTNNGGVTSVSVYRNTDTANLITTASFATRVEFTSGATYPHGLAVADYDGDGKPDMAVANNNGDNVSVFRNTSTPGAITSSSFAAAVSYPAGVRANNLDAADMNGDGKADIVVANYNGSSISVLLNSSSSGAITATSFTNRTDYATGTNPNGISVGDLDGDSKPDIVVANYAGASFSVFRNNPQVPPTITAVSPYNAVAGATVTITGANFNATPVNNVVYFGGAKAMVTSGSTTTLAVTAPAGAIFSPIAVTDSANSGLSAFSPRPYYPSFSNAAYLPGVVNFSAKSDIAINAPQGVTLADLDGDGKLDMLVANNSAAISVYRNVSVTGTVSSGSFATAVDIATGNNPYFIKVADIDGDGKPDIVTNNRGSNSVSILRNIGSAGAITTGSFATKVDYTMNSSINDVTVADFDGDGKPDIAAVVTTGPAIMVRRNTSYPGTIAFSVSTSFTSGTTPSKIAAADIDGDAKPDIVVANYGAATISVLRNTATAGSIGSSSFAAKVDFTTGTNPFGLAVADIDNDGQQDIIVANYGSGTLSLFKNTATSGTISTSSLAAKVDFTTGTNPNDITVADFDGDSRPDIAVANYNSSSLSIFRNTAAAGTINSSALATRADFTTAAGPYGIASGDIDGDGKPDVVTSNNAAYSISVLRNNPPLYPPVVSSIAPAIAVPGTAITITGSNFNTVTAKNIVYFGGVKATVTGGSSTALTVTAPAGATTLPVSVLDSATALTSYAPNPLQADYDNTPYISGQVNMSAQATLSGLSNARATYLSDIDGDGKPDIVVANTFANAIAVYRNVSATGAISSSSFSAMASYTVSTLPYYICIADIDGDGKPDIVASNRNAGTISVLRNTSVPGTISFASKADFGTGSTPYGIAVADFDLDGHPDIAVANNGSASVSVLKNKSLPGSISFYSQVSFTTGTNPMEIAARDLDGDGKADLAVTNYGAATVSVLRNTATTGFINSSTFAAKVDFTTGTNPQGIVAADMDYDGKPDLAVTNYTSSTLSLFRNTATTGDITTSSFAAKVDFVTGTNPMCISIADVDGDAKQDILVANYTSNTISVFRNTTAGAGITSSALAARVNFTVGTNPTGIASGDLNNDNLPDVVVTNYGANSISVLGNNPLVPITGPTTACLGAGPVTLTNTTGGGSWSSSATGVASINATTGVVTPVTAGTAIITYTVNGGSDTALITVGAVPVVVLSASSTTLCSGYSLTLTAGGAATYSWASAALLSATTGGIVYANPAATTIFSVTGRSAEGCVASATKSVTVVPAANANITSAPVLCWGHPVTITIAGNAGDTITWSADGGAYSRNVLAGGTYSIYTGAAMVPHTYLLHAVNNAGCSKIIDTSVALTPTVMSWQGSAGANWNAAANWSCGSVPAATDSVVIPGGVTTVPVLSAATAVNHLCIGAGAGVQLADGAVLTVKGNLQNAGQVTGNGRLSLGGTSTQYVSGSGSVGVLELNNSAGAQILSASAVCVVKELQIASGTLNTNDSLILLSDIMGTARIAEMPAAGAHISGKVQVRQYIQGNYRRYRFWSHPFSSAISLGQLQSAIDVTGSGGAVNGFTPTITNAPSAFRYDPRKGNSSLGYDPGWKPFTKINGAAADSNQLQPYQGIRLFVRGAKGQGLNGMEYVPMPATLAMAGAVNQGRQVVRLVKGTTNPANQEFNMVGNPYPSPVDIGTVLYNAKLSSNVNGAAFYVWNTAMGAGGQYQAIEMDGSPYYLPAYSCFQVRAAHNGDSLVFNESNKGTESTTYLFRNTGEHIKLGIYDADDHLWDMLTVKFDNNATAGNDNNDAVKPMLADFAFYSLAAEGDKLAIDVRPYDSTKIIPLGINTAYAQQYVIKAESASLSANKPVYLHDKYLAKYVLLQQGAAYPFSTTGNKATQGEARFELTTAVPAFVPANISVDLLPNPATDRVVVHMQGAQSNAQVTVTDMLGTVIYTGQISSGKLELQTAQWPSGTYIVSVASGNQQIEQKLVKE